MSFNKLDQMRQSLLKDDSVKVTIEQLAAAAERHLAVSDNEALFEPLIDCLTVLEPDDPEPTVSLNNLNLLADLYKYLTRKKKTVRIQPLNRASSVRSISERGSEDLERDMNMQRIERIKQIPASVVDD